MLTRSARLVTAAVLAAATSFGITPSAATVQAAADTHANDVRITAAATGQYNDAQRPQQWALTALRAETLHLRRKATGVVVAVIDSGVQGTHPDLQGRVLRGYDFTTNKPGGNIDGYGHGTHIAGIIAANTNNAKGVAGLAPEATIMPLRVLDNTGAGWGSDVGRALRYAADNGAKVASISLSSRYSQAVADAVVYAQSKGVIVVAAVGNDKLNGNPVPYPAALPGVIGVGASDAARRVASFSSTGSFVDVTAPGVSITSTYKGSTYAAMNGTSMATPYVAATVAVLVAQKRGLTAAAATKALTSTALDLGAKGKDDATGYGQIQPVKAFCTVARCL